MGRFNMVHYAIRTNKKDSSLECSFLDMQMANGEMKDEHATRDSLQPLNLVVCIVGIGDNALLHIIKAVGAYYPSFSSNL